MTAIYFITAVLDRGGKYYGFDYRDGKFRSDGTEPEYFENEKHARNEFELITGEQFVGFGKLEISLNEADWDTPEPIERVLDERIITIDNFEDEDE